MKNMNTRSKKKILALMLLAVVLVITGLAVSYGIPLYKEYREKKAEEKRRSQEPYFTEFHLTWEQMYAMWYYYGIGTTPQMYFIADPEDEEWPDYSYFIMKPTSRAERVVVVLTYRMFVNPKYEEEERASILASGYGLSAEKPMTVDWVLEHPVEAVEIMQEANYIRDGYHRIDSMVDDVYDEIMGTQEEREIEREE